MSQMAKFSINVVIGYYTVFEMYTHVYALALFAWPL